MVRRRRVLVFLLIVAVVGVALLLSKGYYTLLHDGHPVAFAHEQQNLKVHGSYPEFNRTSVDTSIRMLIDDDIILPASGSFAGHLHPAGTLHEVTVSYRVPYRTIQYAGVVFGVSVRSAERPVEFVLARTYDLLHDRVVKLEDFAVRGKNPYAAAVNGIQFALAGRPGIDRSRMARGLRPEEASLSDFIVRLEGLEFYLNPGAVAAPEDGVIAVTVPWEAMPELQK